MEMATLEAQRVAQATQAALEDSDDEEELMRIAAATAQKQASPLRLWFTILLFPQELLRSTAFTGATSGHLHRDNHDTAEGYMSCSILCCVVTFWISYSYLTPHIDCTGGC